MKIEELEKLNIDNLYNFVRNEIQYGWVDNKNKKHFCTNNDDKQYNLQTPEETLERKIAICWDKTELLRYYFEKNEYKVQTFFIYLYINDNYCPSHSIIEYKKNSKYIWFDPCNSSNIQGIRKYNNEQELLYDLKRRFYANGFLNNFFDENNDLKKIECYEYYKPEYHIKGSEFYEHCRNGRKIII